MNASVEGEDRNGSEEFASSSPGSTSLTHSSMKQDSTRGRLPETDRPDWLTYPPTIADVVCEIQGVADYSPWWVPLPDELMLWKPILQSNFPDRELAPFCQKQGTDEIVCFEKGHADRLVLVDVTGSLPLEKDRGFASLADFSSAVQSDALSHIQELLAEIQGDERIKRNLDWGSPRSGHDEGTIAGHVEELRLNLGAITSLLSPVRRALLEVLILTHDTFKGEALPKVSILDARSHSSLAAEYIRSKGDYPSLESMLQYHDMPFSMWKASNKGTLDDTRVAELIGRIQDWDTFLPFQLIDNLTLGKEVEPTRWTVDVFAPLVTPTVDIERMFRVIEEAKRDRKP